MDVKNKKQWRRSNKTLAIEIAEITESFGKELADKWSNETSAISSSEDNIGEDKYFSLLFFNQKLYLLVYSYSMHITITFIV